jgi:hypothetical protein
LFSPSSQTIPLVLINILLFPWLWRIGRWAQVSTKVNGETRARLGQSAKRSATIRGQAGRGATVAGRRLPGVAEQKLGIFCLPAFVEDHGQIRFSRHAPSFMCATRERERERHTHTHREDARSSAFFTGEISPKSENEN